MADQPSKQSRKLKPAQTVRQRTQSGEAKKPRRLRRAATTTVKTPVRLTAQGLGIIFHPLRFVLKPFRLRPVRFIGRLLATILLLRYFRGSWQELRQVDWPGRKETRKLMLAVFTFAILFGAIIAVVDYGLDKVFKGLLIK